MSDFPDPDEEYELMYADELELLHEEEDHNRSNVVKKNVFSAKRSLDFTSPATSKSPVTSEVTINDNIENNSQVSTISNLLPFENDLTQTCLSNKRTVDDLFGDVADIDFEDAQLPSKRQKTEEENDWDLINKIIEGRKLNQILSEPSKLKNKFQPVFDWKENLSLDIPSWTFIPVTNSDGDRIYVRLESEGSWEISLDKTTGPSFLQSTYAKTWEEARKILETKKEEKDRLSQTQLLPTEIVDTHSSSLWVDKYRPQSYVDLLSEEPVNRALLHWLHLWDKIVFKKEVKTKDPQQRNAFSKRAGQFQLSNKWKGKKEVEPEMDEDGRPHHKVALLCGPPGVGKTTLAHLLAQLAGYRPVELNASDERSTEAFRTALQSATLMRSVLDSEKRPNCLILDEIDGAPLPTVELLVKWCTTTLTDSKKKGKPQALRRPVIAICNDLYANSLRPLRPVSMVIHVGGVSLPRLSARLCGVAHSEGLQVAPHVAAALAARAQGDVRAAIQVLSFIRAKATQLNMEDVENASIGTKDSTKSMMQALQAIFTINDKAGNILNTVQAAGEYDRLVDGIFENYLTARVDSRLLIACETLAWLRLYDTINSWTLKNQNYSLYGALPLCIAKCHYILASRTPQRLKFPIQAQEVYRKKAEMESISWSVWRGCNAAMTMTRNCLQLDLLPLLPYLLAPVLRSANVQLCSENERKTLRNCAGAMCDYGLQYVQQRTPEGLYAFVLEPDIFKVAFYGTEERVRPPPAVRQAIAREQQLEIIRRNEEMLNRVRIKERNEDRSAAAAKSVNQQKVDVADSRLPNHLQRLRPKEIQKKAPQVHKDFFGRIVPLSQIQRQDAIPDVISSSSVFYQYREGFNNAVRRNVKTKDLL